MSKNTGGPAFPTNETHYEGEYAGQGLTVRDYFAAKAMQALLSGPDRDRFFISHAAYRYANAMIAERDSERRT